MNKYPSFISKLCLFICMLTLNNCSSSINFSPTELPQAIVNMPYSACIYVTNARIENLQDIQISTISKDEDIHILSLQERNIRLRYNENLNHALQMESYPKISTNILPKTRKQNYNEIWLSGIPKHTGKVTLILTGNTSKSNIRFKQNYILTILPNNNQ